MYPMYFFLWGQLKEHIYVVPLRTTEHLGAMFKADVTAVDADVIRYVRENEVRCTAFGLATNGSRLAHLL